MPNERTLVRVNRRRPCPVCEKTWWCRVEKNGRYTICNRIESPRPARYGGEGWIHYPDSRDNNARAARPNYQTENESPRASPDWIAHVYRALLGHATLEGRHQQALLARGFTEKEIRKRRYRTLAGGRAGLCRAIHEGEFELLCGVPGFYQKQGDNTPYWSIAGVGGLLIPCLSPDGDVRGLRVRVDEPGEGGKYRWLSSGDKPGGAGSGAHCHVARPTGEVLSETVWITEGELKADFSADRLGAVVLSVPGVSSWALALADLEELLPDGGRVVVAFDSDWREKPPVHEAMWNLALASEAQGYTVEFATWDTESKGLDDLLATGSRPTRTSLAELPAPAWLLRVRSRRMADALPQPRATAATGLAEERVKTLDVAGIVPLSRCA
jgi:hypothetical protein